MSSFKSINFTDVQCEVCGARTIIEPGKAFSGLNCYCDSEISTPVSEIKVYSNGDQEVEVVGTFSNGDIEARYLDGSMNYRIPISTFNKQFVLLNNNLTLEYLLSKSQEEVENEFTIDSLRNIAKTLKMRSYMSLEKKDLIDRIIKRVNS